MRHSRKIALLILIIGLGFGELYAYRFPYRLSPIACQEFNVTALHGPDGRIAYVTTTVCDGFGGSEIARVKIIGGPAKEAVTVFQVEAEPRPGEKNPYPALKWETNGNLEISESAGHRIIPQQRDIPGMRIDVVPSPATE